MIYSKYNLNHSFNIMYEAEEHDVKFGLLVSAMQDPFNKTILTGFSLNDDNGRLRIDNGTFAYDATIVQTYDPIFMPYPSSINQTEYVLPKVDTVVLPPNSGSNSVSEFPIEYPPGYTPPTEIIPSTGSTGSTGSNGTGSTTVSSTSVAYIFGFTPGLSIRLAPNIDNDEYAIVDSFEINYLDRDNGDVTSLVYDFHNISEHIYDIQFNKKAVVFKFLDEITVKVTGFKTIFNNTLTVDNSSIENVEDQTILDIQMVSNNDLTPTDVEPWIRNEAIIKFNKPNSILNIFTDSTGSVFLYEHSDYSRIQSSIGFENNKCAVLFYEDLLIIDQNGLSLMNNVTCVNSKITVTDIVNDNPTVNKNYDDSYDKTLYDKIKVSSTISVTSKVYSNSYEEIVEPIKYKYYFLELWSKTEILTRGMNGIHISDSTRYGQHLDESFIGYSLTFNGGKNWLYTNNIDSELMLLRYPTYDPVLSVPIPSEVLNSMFQINQPTTSTVVRKTTPVYDITNDYLANSDTKLIELIQTISQQIQVDDNTALNGNLIVQDTQNSSSSSATTVDVHGESINVVNTNNANNNGVVGSPVSGQNSSSTSTYSLNQYKSFNNDLTVILNSLNLDSLNQSLNQNFTSANADPNFVYGKVIVVMRYYKKANSILFEIKDSIDLTQYDCIIGTLVATNPHTFYISYRDIEYPRMIPYAEWNEIDTISYVNQFLPAYGNMLTPIVIGNVDYGDVPDLGTGEVLMNSEKYDFNINPINQSPTINNVTLSGTGTPGLIVQSIDANGNRFETTIDAVGNWKIPLDSPLDNGEYTFAFEVFNDEDVLVGTGKTNTFNIDTQTSIFINTIQNQNSYTFNITGIGEANGQVKLSIIDSNNVIQIIGSTIVSDSGYWVVENQYEFPDGDYVIKGTITDEFGNVDTTESNTFTFTLYNPDTTPANNSGTSSGGDTTVSNTTTVNPNDGGSSIPPTQISNSELISGTLREYSSANLLAKMLAGDYDKIVTIVDFENDLQNFSTDGYISKSYIGLNQGEKLTFFIPFPYTITKFMIIPTILGNENDFLYDVYCNDEEVLFNYELHPSILQSSTTMKIDIISRSDGLGIAGIGVVYNQTDLALTGNTRINHLRDRSAPLIKYVSIDNNKTSREYLETNSTIDISISWEAFDINGLNMDLEIYNMDNKLLGKFNDIKEAKEVISSIISDYINVDYLEPIDSSGANVTYKYPIRFDFINIYGTSSITEYILITDIQTVDLIGSFGRYQMIDKINTDTTYVIVLIIELKYPIDDANKTVKLYLSEYAESPDVIQTTDSSYIAIEIPYNKSSLPITSKIELYVEYEPTVVLDTLTFDVNY